MAIINRDLDPSQQKDVVAVNLGAVATGVTRQLFVAPYPGQLQTVRSSAAGVSNAMQLAFSKLTFVAAGSTAIGMGISNMILQNTSTSGVIGYSGLAAQSSTLLLFQAGDVIQVVSSVANGNATDLAIALVVKRTQDIVSMNSLTT
jgi:hypothetical protein